MSVPIPTSDPRRPILLAVLGGSAVSIALCIGALQRLEAAPTPASIPENGGVSPTTEPDSMATIEAEIGRSACAAQTASPAGDSDWERPQLVAVVPVTRAKERDLRAAFVALERAEPGALAARAAEILSGTGPVAEKIALLRALRDTSAPVTVRWLDVLIRAADARTPSLTAFALEQLTELATQDAEACAALGRLAFDAGNVAIDLRRRASAGFAAACPGDRLWDLNGELWREPDELVVASALSALETRRNEPQVRRILAIHEDAHANGANSSD